MVSADDPMKYINPYALLIKLILRVLLSERNRWVHPSNISNFVSTQSSCTYSTPAYINNWSIQQNVQLILKMLSVSLFSFIVLFYAVPGLGMSMMAGGNFYGAPINSYHPSFEPPRRSAPQFGGDPQNSYSTKHLYQFQSYMSPYTQQQGFYGAGMPHTPSGSSNIRQRDRHCNGANCGYWGGWENCHGAYCGPFYDFRPCHSPQCYDGPVQGLNCHNGNCQRVCLDGMCHDFVCSGKKCPQGGSVMTKSLVEKKESAEGN